MGPSADWEVADKENVGGNGESGCSIRKGKQEMLPKVSSDSGSPDQSESTRGLGRRSPLRDKTPRLKMVFFM